MNYEVDLHKFSQDGESGLYLPEVRREKLREENPVLKQIKTNGYYVADTQLSVDFLKEADDEWRELVKAVPWNEFDEIKCMMKKRSFESYPYNLLSQDFKYSKGEPDIGIWTRSRDENKDDKIFLHYYPDVFEDLVYRVDVSNDTRERVIEFTQQYCKPLWTNVIEEVLRPTIEILDKDFTGVYERFFPEKGGVEFIIRALCYWPTNSEGLLAGEHVDIAGTTVAIYESEEGLEVSPPRENVRDLSYNSTNWVEGRVKIWTGLKMEDVITDSKFRKLSSFHRVSNKRGISNQDARTAWIGFLNPFYLTRDFLSGGRIRKSSVNKGYFN